MSDIRKWRLRYQRAGFTPIPLAPNSKQAICDEWQIRFPDEQWDEVGDSFSGNIGVRPGDGAVGIDCDDARAVESVEDWMGSRYERAHLNRELRFRD